MPTKYLARRIDDGHTEHVACNPDVDVYVFGSNDSLRVSDHTYHTHSDSSSYPRASVRSYGRAEDHVMGKCGGYIYLEDAKAHIEKLCGRKLEWYPAGHNPYIFLNTSTIYYIEWRESGPTSGYRYYPM